MYFFFQLIVYKMCKKKQKKTPRTCCSSPSTCLYFVPPKPKHIKRIITSNTDTKHISQFFFCHFCLKHDLKWWFDYCKCCYFLLINTWINPWLWSHHSRDRRRRSVDVSDGGVGFAFTKRGLLGIRCYLNYLLLCYPEFKGMYVMSCCQIQSR